MKRLMLITILIASIANAQDTTTTTIRLAEGTLDDSTPAIEPTQKGKGRKKRITGPMGVSYCIHNVQSCNTNADCTQNNAEGIPGYESGPICIARICTTGEICLTDKDCQDNWTSDACRPL